MGKRKIISFPSSGSFGWWSTGSPLARESQILSPSHGGPTYRRVRDPGDAEIERLIEVVNSLLS